MDVHPLTVSWRQLSNYWVCFSIRVWAEDNTNVWAVNRRRLLISGQLYYTPIQLYEIPLRKRCLNELIPKEISILFWTLTVKNTWRFMVIWGLLWHVPGSRKTMLGLALPVHPMRQMQLCRRDKEGDFGTRENHEKVNSWLLVAHIRLVFSTAVCCTN